MPEPVVVTGLGIVSPVGVGVPAFAAALRAGATGFRAVPDEAGGTRFAAPLTGFDLAAALAAATPGVRREALRAARRSPLPVQAGVAAAVEAWQHAGLAGGAVPADRVGLIVGGHNLTGGYAFEHHPVYLRQPVYLPARYALQVQDTDHVATISQALGVTGEGHTVGASSASGNLALIQAARLIAAGAVDACLAVGALARPAPPERAALANLGVLAPPAEPACHPFDRRRAGLVPGEAAACLVLEPAGAARRRGATPLAELAGVATGLDATSLSTPSPAGEERVMRQALARAGVAPSAVDYVNAHGTATPAGDDAELAALAAVFGPARPWINSTKGLVGHCLSAAGAVEAIATVVQLRAGFVHANPGLRRPAAPGHRLVGATAVPAPIEVALSTSFGFGGFNTAVVLRRG
ncbi:beta-ketoacyl synthase N-terminal-like domain-containing protein [Paractinoplanes atraurantiacus]|uniref:Malonyl-ACP decarboxylase n=1 Tax=Paractinoplanes atraurantiacus TaxID=1036182 RepID=A0A285GLM3_9ACTN|nr:beta-ketoacyl synthase N-terminal-like domain-containing protein [Actinoplanes atraurantiacus]SNY24462.1 malonyl-ACP decarboxylase [Actinoplanes atraurantiacus]